MKKAAGIFVRHETARDAYHPTQGNPTLFCASICGLIDAGHAVAVGENSIEKTFSKAADFKKWFAGTDYQKRSDDDSGPGGVPPSPTDIPKGSPMGGGH